MATAFDARERSTTWLEGLQRRRLALLTVLVIGLSIGFARLVMLVDFGVAGGLFIVAALVAIGMQPRYGLYLLFADAMLFDGVILDPLMKPGWYLNTSLQTTFKIQGGVLIPFEMILLLTSAIWLAHGIMRRQVDLRFGSLGLPVLLFTLALLWGVVRGTLAGANVTYTFWECRFLFSLVLVYILAANAIRTRAHVRTLLSLVFVCLSLAGLEGVWRKYGLINEGRLADAWHGGVEFFYGHDGMIIWAMLIMMVVAQAVLGGPRWQRRIGPISAIVMTCAMLISQRRAGIIALIIAMLVFALMLIRINRKAFLLLTIPAALIFGSYLVVFWDNQGTVGQGARAVRSINNPDPRDASSNAWRDMEAVNVRATIASDPLLGIGFGRPFLQVVTVPDISGFEFWNYEAHHNVLWVWMKMGALGFVAFFLLILAAIARSIWLARTIKFPELRTFAILAVSAAVMAPVYCYVDLGLTESRIPLVLGVMLGTVGVLDRIHE